MTLMFLAFIPGIFRSISTAVRWSAAVATLERTGAGETSENEEVEDEEEDEEEEEEEEGEEGEGEKAEDARTREEETGLEVEASSSSPIAKQESTTGSSRPFLRTLKILAVNCGAGLHSSLRAGKWQSRSRSFERTALLLMEFPKVSGSCRERGFPLSNSSSNVGSLNLRHSSDA
eukprot:GHVT01075468.1.p2 GENE.GHVT01075468.1~~GHVT01075468.1.p2  ORF type:complete len:175 (+),score=37.16 GHVT01075468.1:2705-3229(+)